MYSASRLFRKVAWSEEQRSAPPCMLPFKRLEQYRFRLLFTRLSFLHTHTCKLFDTLPED
jgi:hypothetical protein